MIPGGTIVVEEILAKFSMSNKDTDGEISV